jgi:hypothetical protein
VAQRDVVLRWIEQLGRLVARLLGRGSPGDLAAARDQVDEAVASLLGPLAQLLPRLEADSAAELLGDPERTFAYAQLLDLDAAVRQAMGEPEAAREVRARAVALGEAAVSRAGGERTTWIEWIAARTGAGAPGRPDAADR